MRSLACIGQKASSSRNLCANVCREHAHAPARCPAPMPALHRRRVAAVSGRPAPAAARPRSSNLKPCRAARAAAEQEMGFLGGEDFYSLLGVPPTASTLEIKAAYRGLMRELHPDLAASFDAEAQEQATTLACLLNDIYDTLGDEDKRATYDAMSGFCTGPDSVNPFDRREDVRDQAFVDEVSCIGCGKCVRMCPETYEIEESLFGRARVINQQGNGPEEIQISMDACPVSCIHWVTLPQLPLLETALAGMPRTDAFVMQRNQNVGGDVFWEAWRAYERRRSLLLERVAAAQHAQQWAPGGGGFWGGWGGGKSSGDQEQEQQQQPGDSREARRIGTLAAMAARASRLWRQHGGAIRKPKGSLTE